MTVDANQNVPGGDNSNAGGDGAGGEQQTKPVSYETYKRSVDAEKNLKKQLAEVNARLAAFENEKKSAEEKKLLEQNQHVQVIEDLKKQLSERDSQLNHFQSSITESRKLNQAIGLLNQKGIQLDPKYISLIPIDQIQVDAEGRPDPASVVKAIDSFVKDHPRLVAALPNDLPGTKTGGTAGQISYEQWKSLPYAEKLKQQKNVKMPNA